MDITLQDILSTGDGGGEAISFKLIAKAADVKQRELRDDPTYWQTGVDEILRQFARPDDADEFDDEPADEVSREVTFSTGKTVVIGDVTTRLLQDIMASQVLGRGMGYNLYNIASHCRVACLHFGMTPAEIDDLTLPDAIMFLTRYNKFRG